jgi:hypothetical protein
VRGAAGAQCGTARPLRLLAGLWLWRNFAPTAVLALPSALARRVLILALRNLISYFHNPTDHSGHRLGALRIAHLAKVLAPLLGAVLQLCIDCPGLLRAFRGPQRARLCNARGNLDRRKRRAVLVDRRCEAERLSRAHALQSDTYGTGGQRRTFSFFSNPMLAVAVAVRMMVSKRRQLKFMEALVRLWFKVDGGDL